ncbi:hypothetical protein PFMALIP_05812 [Plasmodium falciparum MaliPS096_E11]|uniref:Uncharacterized protein n=1 Tax=Plasmodium falciparum MaliPS096_E11 TaxID=1036727 RepID=A0A024WG45_PLAFA|nr:hypothetical protein PFMALIP_05812 [Plasmodium falciparum MaliPS096_E11]
MKVGPEIPNIGPNVGNIGLKVTNVGPNIPNIGPKLTKLGPICTNISRKVTNLGPKLTNLCPIVVTKHTLHGGTTYNTCGGHTTQVVFCHMWCFYLKPSVGYTLLRGNTTQVVVRPHMLVIPHI